MAIARGGVRVELRWANGELKFNGYRVQFGKMQF
jgi:hypothetical protein